MARPEKSTYQGSSLSLETLLVAKKLLTLEQVDTAHRFIDENNVNFGTAIMFLKLVDPNDVGKLLLRAHVESVTPQAVEISAKAKSLVPIERAKELQVFPLNMIEDSGQNYLLLAMTDPLDTSAIVKVEQMARMKVQPVFITLDDLQALYKKYFRGGLSLFPVEMTGSYENTAKRRIDSVVRMKTPPSLSAAEAKREKTEFQALLSLLIKKGIITLDEFQRHLRGSAK